MDYARSRRRILAELEEAHTRAVYGVFTYSYDQAELLVRTAKELIQLLRGIEESLLGG